MIDAKTLWKNIINMKAASTFNEDTPEWEEATRCRIAGYLHALSDFGVIPKDQETKIFSEVWLWYSWNKKELKNRRSD